MKQTGVGDVLLPVHSEMKGETVKWVVVHGGKGGHMIRVSRGDGSGCVAEEQNDLQEGFFFSRQGNQRFKPGAMECHTEELCLGVAISTPLRKFHYFTTGYWY